MTGDYLLSLRIFLQYHLSSVVSSDKSPASLITFSLKLLYIFLFVFLDISLPLFFFFFFLRFHYGMSRCAFLMNYPDQRAEQTRTTQSAGNKHGAQQ